MTGVELEARRYAADVLRTVREMHAVSHRSAMTTFQKARNIAADNAALSLLAGNDARARIAAEAWRVLGRAENRQVSRVITALQREFRREAWAGQESPVTTS